MERSEIAIIIPAYNEASTIENILREVIKYGTVILINDGSTDNTLELAKKYDIKIINNEKNFGYDKSLNIDLKDGERKIWDNDGVLIFDTLDVEKKYRGEGIGNLLLDSVCHDYRRSSRFALLKAFPLQYVGSIDKDLDDEKKAKIEKEKIEFKNRNFETSRKKLVELYKKSGFEIISGTEDFMVCDLRYKFD